MKKCTHFYKAGDSRALFHLSPWTPKNKSTLPFFGGGGGRDKGRRERGLTSLGSGAELNTLTSEVRL